MRSFSCSGAPAASPSSSDSARLPRATMVMNNSWEKPSRPRWGGSVVPKPQAHVPVRNSIQHSCYCGTFSLSSVLNRPALASRPKATTHRASSHVRKSVRGHLLQRTAPFTTQTAPLSPYSQRLETTIYLLSDSRTRSMLALLNLGTSRHRFITPR